MSRTSNRFSRRNIAVVVAGLIVAQLWLANTVADRSLDRSNAAAAEELERRADRTMDLVEREIYSYLPTVRGVAAHYAVAQNPHPDEFGQLVDELEVFEAHESVAFLTWAQRVEVGEVDQFTADAEASGRPDFSISFLNEDVDWHAIAIDGAARLGELPLPVDVTFDPGVAAGLSVAQETGRPALAQLMSTAEERAPAEQSREFVDLNELNLSYLLVMPVAHPGAEVGDPVKGWIIAQLALPTGASVEADGLLPFDVGIVTDGRVRRTQSSDVSLRTEADRDNRWEQRLSLGEVEWEVRTWATSDDINYPFEDRRRETWLFVAGTIAFTLLGALVVGASVSSKDKMSSALSASRQRLRTDPLTGSLNRLGITERLTGLTDAGVSPTVVFCDVDNFKRVNDSLGHEVGDEMLRLLARRLERSVGSEGAVARFGGDEFVIVTGATQSAERAEALAEAVREVTAEPFSTRGGLIETTISVGFTRSLGADRDAGDLLRDADAAMYRAKRDGGDRASEFDEQLRASVNDRLAIEQELRTASTDGSLHCVYQTLHRCEDLSVWGVEALVRWNRPGVGIVSPGVFLPVAEESAQVLDIGGWVIEEACRFGVALRNHIPDAVMTANLSVRQLADPSLMDRVQGAIEASGLDPAALCLEINEDALVHSANDLGSVLTDLKQLGVRLALDDFGSGRTSLTHLAELHMLDIVKLDRRFVTNLVESEVEQSIVRAVNTIARVAGMEVVVEGVETEEQAQILIDLGVELLQGFHLSRPAPAGSSDLEAALGVDQATSTPRR